MFSLPQRRFTVGSVITVLLLLVRCGINTVAGGTESGNARLVGTLYLSDGKTPAVNVKVNIRPKTLLADTSIYGLKKSSSVTNSAVTDNRGFYIFDSTLVNGTYVIEASSGNEAVLIEPVLVSKESTDTLPPDTLKPVGAITGTVRLSEGDDPRKVLILAFGLDRIAHVEADGKFTFSNLAEAAYDLRIIASLDNYGVFDTTNVVVSSGNSTDLGVLTLPFTGIPTIHDLSIDYDTLIKTVTLTWSSVDTTMVSGYHIYRRNVDSNTIPMRLNTSALNTTQFRDTTIRQEFTYEYNVTIVDRQGNEGILGNWISVITVGAYKLVRAILTEEQSDKFILERDKLFICSYNGQKIEIIDTLGHAIGFFGDNGAYALKDTRAQIEYQNEIIYVVDDYDDSILPIRKSVIKCYDLSGELIKTIPYNRGQIRSFTVLNGNEFFIIDYRTDFERWSLFKIDSNSTVLDSVGNFKFQHIELIDSALLCSNYEGKIQWLNQKFEILEEMTLPPFSMMTVDSYNNRYTIVDNDIFIFDATGNLQVKFQVNGATFINAKVKGTLYIATNENKILIYKKRTAWE